MLSKITSFTPPFIPTNAFTFDALNHDVLAILFFSSRETQNNNNYRVVTLSY